MISTNQIPQEKTVRFLFVKPMRMGDALLLTPTLRAVKQSYPKAEIWVLVRRGSEGILAGCPEIDHILTMAGPDDRKINARTLMEGIRDLASLRQVRFDFVIEMSDSHRGRLFASLARSHRRYSIKLFGKMNRWEKWRFQSDSLFEWESRHRVERDFYSTAEFLPLKSTTPPPLVFERGRTQAWPKGANLQRFCVLQIGTWKDECRWCRKQWLEVASGLLNHYDHIVISTGSYSREVEDALWLREQLGPRLICTLGETTWAQVAELLYAAEMYIGLDTATMHLAAACGCPIVAIFPTTEDRWHPWLARYQAVLPKSYRAISDPMQQKKLRREPRPQEITALDVLEACEDMRARVRQDSISDRNCP